MFHIWWKGSEAGIPEDKDLVTLDGTVKKNLGESPSEVRKSVAFCLGVSGGSDGASSRGPRQSAGSRGRLKWFSQECRRKRGAYRRAQRVFKNNPNEQTRNDKNRLYTEYKRMVKCNYSKYVKSVHTNIRSLRTSDLRGFWNLVKKKKVIDDITHDIFVKHF